MSGGARAIAWLVTIAAIALGLTAHVPVREPLRHGAYVVLAADFHVHSFPGDGALMPWDIAVEAQRRGLDAVALTNHNAMYSWRLVQRLTPNPAGAMLIAGAELTSDGYHLATAGLHRPVAWRQPVAAAATAVHAQGGVAIAAHPVPPHADRFESAALDVLDGFEAAHPVMHMSDEKRDELAAFRTRAAAHPGSLAFIGSSDFHHFAPLGVCRTFVFAADHSEAGLLDGVRQGRTVACDGRGETYGPADLAAAVSPECRRVAAARPEGWRWTDAVSTWGAWLGLVALVALGSKERSLC